MALESARLRALSGRKAIYLRKSRGDVGEEHEVLAKHRADLIELCERYGYTDYDIYEEVKGAALIDSRPQLLALMDAVADETYDALLVKDLDRLSRGNGLDRERIKDWLGTHDVLVITPEDSYDFADEQSETLIDFKQLMGRAEYTQIKKRLRDGKIRGVKQGNWTQGNPPFPYLYDKIKKALYVDENLRPHYIRAKEMALGGASPQDIAYDLNGAGIYGRRGKKWYPETVQRMLLNPVHRGQIIYGKTRTVRARKRDFFDLKQEFTRVPAPEEKWIIGYGSHEPLITAEEQARIRTMIDGRRRMATKARAGISPLSGLVKCARCGRTQSATTRRGKAIVQACPQRTPTGGICGNGGADADVIYAAIREAIQGEIARLQAGVAAAEPQTQQMDATLERLRSQADRIRSMLDKLQDLYLDPDGGLSKEAYKGRKAPLDADLRRIQDEISALEGVTATGQMSPEERASRLETALDEMWGDGWTDKERHSLLTALIDRIVLHVDRKHRKRTIEIMFQR